MKAFLTNGSMALPEELGPRGPTPDVVEVGTETVLVKRRWGQGGLGIEWSRLPFGVTSSSTGVAMSHVALERSAMLRGYEGINTRLCAVPIYGYRWYSRDGRTEVVPGWALGFFEEGVAPGFLLVADDRDVARRPVVADWATARTWLLSEKWQQMKLLRVAAEARDAIDESRALGDRLVRSPV